MAEKIEIQITYTEESLPTTEKQFRVEVITDQRNKMNRYWQDRNRYRMRNPNQGNPVGANPNVKNRLNKLRELTEKVEILEKNTGPKPLIFCVTILWLWVH